MTTSTERTAEWYAVFLHDAEFTVIDDIHATLVGYVVAFFTDMGVNTRPVTCGSFK